MKSQELPVPPPPRDGREHTDKEYDHETKAGQEENKRARTSADGLFPPDPRPSEP